MSYNQETPMRNNRNNAERDVVRELLSQALGGIDEKFISEATCYCPMGISALGGTDEAKNISK